MATAASGASSGLANSSAAPAEPTAPPSAKILTPQDRKNKKLQQRLEQALAEAIPAEASQIAQGFILSLAPGSNGKDLTVTLAQSWYQLEAGQQEAIAATLWGQRSDLSFQQLTLEDAQGKTIARNPVVGDEMVILRR